MSTATAPTPGKKAPRSAFAFEPNPLAFRDAAGDERSSPNEHRVSVQARSPGVVNHWYWGRIVHDMAGIRHKDKVPFDWRHHAGEILGYADTITADNTGLTLAGPIQSIDEGDRASEVIRRGRLGQPYEASFHWDEFENVLEYLDEGFVTEVNGQMVEGPCVIAREWTLRACAITPYGVDQTTHTQFSADGSADGEIPVSYRPAEGATMTKDEAKTKPADTAPAEQTEATKDTAPAATVETTKPAGEVNPDATRDAARGELSRYMDRFGSERGAQYFRDSVPYESALEKEVDHLRKESATKDEAVKAAETKLAALQIGEESPIDTGATKDEAKTKDWADLFKKQGS